MIALLLYSFPSFHFLLVASGEEVRKAVVDNCGITLIKSHRGGSEVTFQQDLIENLSAAAAFIQPFPFVAVC